jgi:hypothetical protein
MGGGGERWLRGWRVDAGGDCRFIVVHLKSAFANDLEPVHHDLDGAQRVQVLICCALCGERHVFAFPVEQRIASRVNEACKKAIRKYVLTEKLVCAKFLIMPY